MDTRDALERIRYLAGDEQGRFLPEIRQIAEKALRAIETDDPVAAPRRRGGRRPTRKKRSKKKAARKNTGTGSSTRTSPHVPAILKVLNDKGPQDVESIARALYGRKYKGTLCGPTKRLLNRLDRDGLVEDNEGFYRLTDAGVAEALSS